MAIMLVSYDLNSPGQSYEALIKAIQTYTYRKALKSAWLIDTTESTVNVRDKLRQHIDSGDEIFIVRFETTDWASFISQDVNDWLSSSARNW